MNYYFITGTSKGLGKAITEQLLKDENNFVFGYSRNNVITHKNYYHKLIDLNNLEALKKIQFPVLNNPEKVVLINNAGSVGDINHVGEIDNDQIIACYNINLIAPAIITNNFVSAYKNISNEKLIINISSGAGKSAIDGWSTYCSAKSGIDMFSKVFAEEIKIDNTNFKVLSLAPGIIDTGMQVQIRNSKVNGFSNLDRFIEYKKNGDLASAEETANKVIRFVSENELQAETICSVRDL
ncbi:SDR family NAD(P)-dependent oxidoreductase [Vicingus serpentipes]|uniref:SDR family NAD(P)-dependent oxidoreductase n=1 Tax=Vicingus serpentipes TaxID=1926625 RepID=A0A5C6RRG4_9FLAO|nr:SDR family NAD(P)-dependent oxidoreductase [Vicingus serpentipes]TXB64853.1 SDR family NAD(P)-dependent oxidoreductase [Vicingus serpentipes]